jgi:uncharacterized protein (DUF1697 family)
MPRYVAFLRGINLGNRRIKMDALRGHFEALPELSSVATFIASGNVIFDCEARDGGRLERRIEDHLQKRLGYPVDTFIRSIEEVEAIPALDLFDSAPGPDHGVHVVFLRNPPDAETVARLRALETDGDAFRVAGREAFWLRKGRLTDSEVRAADLDRALGGVSSTMRNMNTVRRLVARYA